MTLQISRICFTGMFVLTNSTEAKSDRRWKDRALNQGVAENQ